jgi:HTH-type transcriptional regulator, sugar sensing transcriptional regulator
MIKKTILEKIGLNKNEAKLYRALIRKKALSISDMVRDTGLHRPTIYTGLAPLIEKGLVSVVPKGRYKQYSAESPRKLVSVLDDISRELTEEVKEMEEEFKWKGKKPVLTYGEGPKAITAAYSDLVHGLKKGDTYFRYSSASVLNRELYVPRDYREVRDKKGLERMVITNEATKKMHTNKLGRIIKTIPTDYDLFNYDITQMMYGDKVSIIDFNSKTAITIEHPQFAEFQKKIFKLLFKKL